MTWEPEDRAIVAERAIERAMALTVACAYCHEPVGQECVNRDTGQIIRFQAAHYRRMQDAGL